MLVSGPLSDELFLYLARRAGSPSEAQLCRCRELQLERARRGQPVSLFETAHAAGLISESFYGNAARALSPGGVFVAQTQSPFCHPTEVCEIFAALQSAFPEVWMYWGVCPSYLGFAWTFCYASHGRRPLDGTIPADAHKALGTRYYTADVHRGAFALPPFLQACLPEGHPQRTV